MVDTCKCCGQALQYVRAGVRLTSLKARVFDLIASRPGISRKELCYQIYDAITEARMYTVGSHIQQIKDKLAHTDTTIKGVKHYGYKIVKRKIREVA